MRNLYRCWVRPELHTKEEICETIILKQLLRILPYEILVWVKEYEPTTGLDAAKLAQQYINGHRGSQCSQPTKGNFRSFSSSSGEPHDVSDVAHAQKVAPEKRLVCFYCQQPCHRATACPVRKSKLTGFCFVPRGEDIEANNVSKTQHVQVTEWTMHECSVGHWKLIVIAQKKSFVTCSICQSGQYTICSWGCKAVPQTEVNACTIPNLPVECSYCR